MHYHFYLVCDDVIYYYNQKEITTYMPDHTYDFVLLADYHQPENKGLTYQVDEENVVWLNVKAHQGYLIACR